MIEWKEGAVFYGGGGQHESRKNKVFGCELVSFCKSSYHDIKSAVKCTDFQLNGPKEGYYIPKSELDTEEKYNQAVEVFGLFGFNRGGQFALNYKGFAKHKFETALICCDSELMGIQVEHEACKVKLTFSQLMVIVELKRKMNERDGRYRRYEGKNPNTSESPSGSKPAKKRKSKEAYRILESMGIEWDNVEGKWFKKEWL